MKRNWRKPVTACLLCLLLLPLMPLACGVQGSSPGDAPSLAGRWSGVYVWDYGQTYDVVLDLASSSNGKGDIRRYTGIESSTGCLRVDIELQIHVKTRRVILDEVAAECPGFILDGLYEGRLSEDGNELVLPWANGDGLTLDVEGDPEPSGPAGVLKLSRN